MQTSGMRLIIRKGKPLQVLQKMVGENETAAIFAEEDYSSYAISRDAGIQKRLPLKLITGLVLHHPEHTNKNDGSPYSTFTHFKNAWKALPQPAKPVQYDLRFPAIPTSIKSLPLPDFSENKYFPANEMEAQGRLNDFIATTIAGYHDRTKPFGSKRHFQAFPLSAVRVNLYSAGLCCSPYRQPGCH